MINFFIQSFVTTKGLLQLLLRTATFIDCSFKTVVYFDFSVLQLWKKVFFLFEFGKLHLFF